MFFFPLQQNEGLDLNLGWVITIMYRFKWEVNLLSKQLVVHLHPLHLFVTLLQSLVTLTQLSDVVAGFGQDASFTLDDKRKNW